jgi:general secretion pathway protein J
MLTRCPHPNSVRRDFSPFISAKAGVQGPVIAISPRVATRFRPILSNAGFTLFEALIAIALMGLILGALATITAQWLPNWNRGLARVQRNEQVAIALHRLVTDLAAAEHVFPNGKIRRPLFDGTEFTVTFVRSALGPNSRPGLEIVRIAEADDAGGRALVRARAPFVPLPLGDPNLDVIPFADPVILLRSPFRVAFAYSRGGKTWSSSWQNSTYLPSAVRFVVRDGASGRTLAVSTATAIHVNMAAPEPGQVEDATPGGDKNRADGDKPVGDRL